ncbi:MAG: DUF3187 family protein [Armatimonadetes bacterium]|nr:DUF3187 family protein [Armatimonadota bacterium]
MRRLLPLLLLWPAIAAAQLFDPIPTRNHRSASLIYLRLPPASERRLKLGEQSVVYSLVVANEFRRVGPIDEDAETSRWELLGTWGVGNGTEVFVVLPLPDRGGGFLDSVIDWWHNSILGDRNALRDGTPRGRSIIQFGSDGPFGSAFGIGDIAVGVGWTPGRGTLIRFAVELPTGNASQLLGSGGVDAGLFLDGSVPLSTRLTLHGSLGWTAQGRGTALSRPRSMVLSSSLALTWQLTSVEALTLQWNAEQSPTIGGIPELDADHRVMSLGYQRWTSARERWLVYISEDGNFRWARFPGGATIGPDLTIGIVYTVTN